MAAPTIKPYAIESTYINRLLKALLNKRDIAIDTSQNLKLTQRQMLAITFIQENGQISNVQYQEIANISKRTASRELLELTEKGILVSEGASRGPGKSYRLAKT